MPNEVPVLVRLRELTAAVREAVADPANVSKAEADQAAAELWALRRELDAQTPFDDAAKARLFAALGEAIGEVYARESEAVRALGAAMASA